MRRAASYAESARSESTRTVQAKDFARFRVWCEAHAHPSLPTSPAVVVQYVASMADGEGHNGVPYAVATIRRHLSSIAATHHRAGHEWIMHRAIVETMRGIARRLGTAQRKAAPLELDALADAFEHYRRDLVGIRDRALLSLGWFLAARRSEIVALEVRDVEFTAEGLRVTIRRSKTDQEGAGTALGVPFAGNHRICPVRLLRRWLRHGGIEVGPIFRRITKAGVVGPNALDATSVPLIVRAACGDRYVAHSLRAGFITTAAKRHKSLPSIMRHSRHKSERVALGYIRVSQVFDDNAAEGLG